LKRKQPPPGVRPRAQKRPRLILPPPPGCDADSVVLTFEVPREQAGLRLDRFIQIRIPRLSRTRAQRIIRACAFRHDGTRRRPAELVRFGEVVLLVRERFIEPEVPTDFDVLLDDGAVLAVDKPPGLPMHPSATYHKNTLTYQLRERFGAEGGFVPQIAHRLDRETSGIVLCGRTRDAERALKACFEGHRVQKTYLAIVRGEMQDDTRRIELAMQPVTSGLHVMMELREDGLPAQTDLRVLARANGHSLVELYPRTGRQHQLRVHLSAIGHPIVGDKLYGPEREAPFLELIETGMTPELLERLGHPRHALHAHAIALPHPVEPRAFEVRSELPADMRALWARIEGAAEHAPAALGLAAGDAAISV
jgi:23S rRNA pseudouridine1911/1915/1917 synthase